MIKIYLAVPYTGMEEKSFKEVNKCAAFFMNLGFAVYSPISQNHPIASEHSLPTKWDFWEKMDYEFLGICDQMMVLCLDGWKKSRGVTAEIQYAKFNKIPITYLNPDNCYCIQGKE